MSTTEMSTGELACVYATLLLHDDGIPITAENITTLVKSANVKVESYWPPLFAKFAEKMDLEDLKMNAVRLAPAPVAMAAPVVSAAAPEVEEKKEEPAEESDDEYDFDLFS